MSVKSKSESVQNVTMFNIFLLESLDASCKDYLISSVRHSHMIGQKLILPSRVQAEIYEVALSYAPVLLLILTHFHYLLVGAASIFYHNSLVPEEIC